MSTAGRCWCALTTMGAWWPAGGRGTAGCTLPKGWPAAAAAAGLAGCVASSPAACRVIPELAGTTNAVPASSPAMALSNTPRAPAVAAAAAFGPAACSAAGGDGAVTQRYSGEVCGRPGHLFQSSLGAALTDSLAQLCHLRLPCAVGWVEASTAAPLRHKQCCQAHNGMQYSSCLRHVLMLHVVQKTGPAWLPCTHEVPQQAAE